MKNSAVLLPALAVLYSFASLGAQESESKPSAPFLESGGEPLTITRTFSYPASKDAAKVLPPGVGQTEILKSVTQINGPISHVITYRRDTPDPTEFWIAAGSLIGPHPVVPSAVVLMGVEGGNDIGDAGQRFPEAGWVTAENFVKWEILEGEKCRVHSGTLPPGKTNFLSPISGNVTAWIAESSRRPMKVTASDKTILFSYSIGPAQPVSLPQRFADYLKMRKLGTAGRAR